MKNYKNFLMTDNSVVVIFEDGLVPIDQNNPLCEKIKNLLLTGEIEEAVETIDVSGRLEKHTSGRFYMVNGIVMLDGEMLPVALSSRLLQFVDSNLPCDALVNFWSNLKDNPSEESKKDLYGFLEHNGIPLTADGYFIAYKRVTADWKDCRTKNIDNSPGAIVKMDRNKVDADRNVTCSSGLHVAAYNYAFGFYPNGILLEVKVNPRDVVSVPVDYNNEKMRVCEYEVIKQCGGEREEPLYDYEDTLDEDCDDEDRDYEDEYDNCSRCGNEFNVDDSCGTGLCPYCEDDEEQECQDRIDAERDAEEEEANRGMENASCDSRGRLCVSRGLIVGEMGASVGDDLYVWTEDRSLVVNVSTEPPADRAVSEYSVYRVDKSGNMRISGSVLKTADIADAAILYLSYDKESNLLTITG